MSGSSILHIGRTGMTAAQAGIRTSGDNMVNANTPGYRRREIQLRSSLTVQHSNYRIGTGVEVASFERAVDVNVERRVRQAFSDLGAEESRGEMLRRVAVGFGDLDGTGLATAVDDLLASFDALAANPADDSARTAVVESAERVAYDLNRYAGDVRRARVEVNAAISTSVEEVNEKIEEIADLNKRIVQAGSIPGELEDRRDVLLDELSQAVEIHVLHKDNGVVDVSLRGGGALVVDDRARLLSSATDANGDVQVTDSGGGPVEGGALGGLFTVRDSDLTALRDNLDNFAYDLATGVNAVHSAGYGLDGVTGRDLFAAPAAVADAARNLQVDAGVAADPHQVAAAQDPLLVPGDNRNAVAMAALRESAFVGGERPADALAGMMEDFGNRMYEAENNAEGLRAVADGVTQIRENISGVSLDEEMVRLLEFRQAYQAAAQLVRTADELLQEAIALKR